jgi:hypothetical protein
MTLGKASSRAAFFKVARGFDQRSRKRRHGAPAAGQAIESGEVTEFAGRLVEMVRRRA